MNYRGTLIAVKDIGKAQQFYHEVLELEVVMDAGEHVQLTEGMFLQTVESWGGFINQTSKDIVLENNAIELYFETEDMDAFIEKLAARKEIEFLHPVMEHSWGQRAVRFYDVDKHIIEVAESLTSVIKGFINSGLTIEETAERMGGDVGYIKAALEQAND
ncbi:VOC family protein [Enterococcus malodoratus]|uniref:VOC family protein n=1 Tax=Enterococcus malodoratus TaxID=71451 RepID=UPI003FD30F14